MQPPQLDHARQALAEGRLEDALRHLREAAAAVEQLLADQRNPPPADANAFPQMCTLHVDGVGGFRIARNASIRIGPVGSAADVPLQGDASMSLITIQRVDEDYFLQSPTPVNVNDQPTTSRLLSDGDRLSLSSRARLTFRLPTPASTTALLQLSGTRTPTGDVRAILMLDREILIGPGPDAHIRADDLDQTILLVQRGAQLHCQAPLDVLIDNVVQPQPVQLPLEKHIQIGPLGLILTRD